MMAIRIKIDVTSNGKQVIAEQQTSHRLRIAEHLSAVHYGRPANGDLVESGGAAHHPNADDQSEDQRRNAEHGRHAAAVSCPLLNSGVEQHDDEDEQHHDRTGINDDLHGGDKLRPQQQVNHGERSHHHNQRQRAVDGMLLREQVNGAAHAHRRENKEKNQMQHDVCPPARILPGYNRTKTLRLLQRHDQAGDNDVRDGQRQKELPAEGHELVIAETRQRAADPDVNEDENENP